MKKKHTFESTVATGKACDLLGTNRPRLIRLAERGHFRILNIGTRFPRIPIEDLLSYLYKVKQKNDSEQFAILRSISMLSAKMNSLISSEESEKALETELSENLRYLED